MIDDDQRVLGLRLYGVSLVLLVVFLTAVLNALLPLHPGDPRWLEGLIRVLLSQGFLPLIALALLHLAVHVNPDSSRLYNRRIRYSRFAYGAALGFVMLIPLHLATSWGALNQLSSNAVQQRSQGLVVIAQMREAVSSSSSHEQLDQRLRNLPVALRGQQLAAYRALPFPERQQQLLTVLARSERQYRLAAAQPEPIPWPLLLESLLRVAPLALALAAGFGLMAFSFGT